MRIISGKWKGKTFNTKIPAGIRPTQDAMRETIFNILRNYTDFEKIVCADICAGTGMFGIEMLSRGAAKVYFVDKNIKSINLINQNINSISADITTYNIYKLDAKQFLNHYEKTIEHNRKLDIIFADPPYDTLVINDILQLSAEKNIISNEGIIVAETAIFSQLFFVENYEILTERQFGASKVTFLKYFS